MSKIAQAEIKDSTSEAPAGVDKLTRTASVRAADTSQERVEASRTATARAGEQHAAARYAAAGSEDFGRTLVELLAEQTRQSMDTTAALSRAVDWAQLAQAQRDFFSGSFARMSQLGDRYREAMLSSLSLMTASARR